MKLRSTIITLLFSIGMITFWWACRTTDSTNPWRNHADGVTYVGKETCRGCHASIYDTYTQTGMGLSFDTASTSKTSARFDAHDVVYDTLRDFFYKPYFENETMWVHEFRLVGTDTIHSRREKIAYIIGSGQHTNSHIIADNGYLFQAPITFYTQEKKWHLAPGFEKGEALRFGRMIESECLTCHNHLPKAVETSLNKFAEVPKGIECERCHGPGSLHAEEKLAGIIVDTSKQADYSIVNPKRLSRDLQMNLCQRCHLQGVAVLEPSKSFYDFLPGMRLDTVWNVFMPRFINATTGQADKMIMASQADRLTQSACYQASPTMSCLNCHNPHVSVKATPVMQYNNACLNCHKSANACSVPKAKRIAQKDNCVSCHMQRTGATDIPHVTITDHNIQKSTAYPRDDTKKQGEQVFKGLAILTKDHPSPKDMAAGYMTLYEKFLSTPIVLDSARYYVNKLSPNAPQKLEFQIQLHFLEKEYQEVLRLSANTDIQKIKEPWTLYRVGQSYMEVGKAQEATQWLEKSVALLPDHLDFQEKLAACYLAQKKNQLARTVLTKVLKDYPKRPVALTNLGYLDALSGNISAAMARYNQALSLDPDYVQAMINKAALLMIQKNNAAAKQLLQRALKLEPQNRKVKEAIGRL